MIQSLLRLLCLLGFHDWRPAVTVSYAWTDPDLRPPTFRCARRCGA